MDKQFENFEEEIRSNLVDLVTKVNALEMEVCILKGKEKVNNTQDNTK